MPLSVVASTAILGLLALPVVRRRDHAAVRPDDRHPFLRHGRRRWALLWQHLFWFFGHPRFILILRDGMVSDIIANVASQCSMPLMVFAIIGIGF
jgi:heme/copper-type cytochrome/quinol oxidase subunit 1